MAKKIRVGLTIGDPSGIGPAITLKAIQKLKGLADFLVIGDRGLLDKACFARYKPGGVKIIDLKNIDHKKFEFGRIKAEYGRASIEYIDRALSLIRDKEIDCLVTCPISKQAINLAGFKYSGHTEYLARQAKTKEFVMMLLNKELKFSLLSRHSPLKEVWRQLSYKNIAKTVLLSDKCLRRLFRIRIPRIVVCGFNPHASDNGLIGSEENRVIKPAIERLKTEFKIHLYGPLPSDVAIYRARQKEYDCVVAIYHDQALIPLKLSGQNSGVNMTLGLPFVRTSALHGTAFDIAKKPPLADPASLIEAIKLGIKCALNQKRV